jgi:uncharacterized SAM-binding protein YcdF (DUF218 family)
MTYDQAMASVVKAALVPGSTAFLLLGLCAGVFLLYRGHRAITVGRLWLTVLSVTYVLLSLPPVSSALVSGLQGRYSSLSDKPAARGARVVVVIGNGAVTHSAGGRELHQLARRTAFAVLEAERLYRLLEPEWIVASGGIPNPSTQHKPESEMMRDELVRLGVPSERILLESSSRTTAEQLSNVARILSEKGLGGPSVLVTTPAHARRAMSGAAAHRLDVIPSVTMELRYGTGETGWKQWRPSVDALRGSESAMYEYLAFLYYRLMRRSAA